MPGHGGRELRRARSFADARRRVTSPSQFAPRDTRVAFVGGSGLAAYNLLLLSGGAWYAMIDWKGGDLFLRFFGMPMLRT
jgi:hypothetical protein